MGRWRASEFVGNYDKFMISEINLPPVLFDYDDLAILFDMNQPKFLNRAILLSQRVATLGSTIAAYNRRRERLSVEPGGTVVGRYGSISEETMARLSATPSSQHSTRAFIDI